MLDENQDNSHFSQELFASLAQTYKKSKQKIKFPTKVSTLQSEYDKKLSNQIKKDLYTKFPQLHGWDSFEVDSLLESQILNALKSRNFYKLKKFIHETIQKFLETFDIFAEFQADQINTFLQDNIEESDKAIFEITEEFQKKEKFDQNPGFKKLNQKIEEVYTILIVYQQLMYSKYEMSDLYSAGSTGIEKDTIRQILDQAIIDYPKVVKDTQKILKGCVNSCLKEFKQTFELNLTEHYTKNPKVATYTDAYQASTRYLLSILKEDATEKLGATPTKVFLSQYNDNVIEAVKDSIIQERLHKYLMQDNSGFQETLYKDLVAIFKGFNYMDGAVVNLFDEKKMGGKTNIARLFSIVFLTDYLELDETRFDLYFYKLQLIYFYFISNFVEEYPVIQEYLQMVNSKQKCINDRAMIRHYLELERAKWKETVSEPQNLYAMSCIFVAFAQTRLEGSSKSYSTHDRYMIKNIFRSLRNGENRFTNFQILCAMESLITNKDVHTDITAVTLSGENAVESGNILTEIRNTLVKSFSEHKKHENQLAKITSKISPHIKKPAKFFLEKISDKNVHSRVINICVSGFTSEDVAKSKEWKGVLQANPHTEVFALNWNSSRLQNLFQFLCTEIKEIAAANAGVVFGFAFPQLRPVLLGLASYNAYKGVKDDLWGKTYQEAINTGIYLAHILSETDLFKDHVINLIGFSLGTLVIMSCIWELERMNRQDVVYDVLLMGGVVNAAEFNKRALKVVGNKIMNCYCKTDYILKFLLKIVSYSTNPIGLGPILCANKKVDNIDVTQKIDGHTKYRDHLKTLLTKVDFNEDINYLVV